MIFDKVMPHELRKNVSNPYKLIFHLLIRLMYWKIKVKFELGSNPMIFHRVIKRAQQSNGYPYCADNFSCC